MDRKYVVLGILIVVLGFALTSGCATPYQPRGFAGGYTDAHLKDNLYHVTFEGNAFIDQSTAVRYLHRRAKELCLENGYKDYTVKDPRDASTQMMMGSYGSGSISASTMNKPLVSGYVECLK